MRLSSVFDSKFLVRFPQSQEHAGTVAAAKQATSIMPVLTQDLPEDLDQRVRQIGEWQLEDW
ncbi:hypothetical protein [Ramlibacter sp.]|uniref:hypothetical protein n=1 Tax=Ramlibacter sp. TaxID=1917967 RepID=UPI0017A9C038|nr:hypothetical protein [Ramlibacter sp.]MBA2674510.1 hypothetical protein [Ramlibacter sp.]